MEDVLERQLAAERYRLAEAARDAAVRGFPSDGIMLGDRARKELAAGDPLAQMLRLQLDLVDRVIPYDVPRQALNVIAQLGITFATDDAERAVEALGMLMVHASVIMTFERLAFEPLIALAEAYEHRRDVQPLRAAGAVAIAVMSQRSSGVVPPPVADYQRALVEALALAIAKGTDDCVIGHELMIDLRGVFTTIAAEVIAGKMPRRDWPIVPMTWGDLRHEHAEEMRDVHDMEQEMLAGMRGRRVEAASLQLQAAAQELELPETSTPEPWAVPDKPQRAVPLGVMLVPPRHAMTQMAPSTPSERHEEARRRPADQRPTFIVTEADRDERIARFGDGSDGAAVFDGARSMTIERPDDRVAAMEYAMHHRKIIDDPASPGDGSGVLELPPGKRYETDAEMRQRIADMFEAKLGPAAISPDICPHCAQPLSEGRDNLLRCDSHTFRRAPGGLLEVSRATPPISRSTRNFPPPRKL